MLAADHIEIAGAANAREQLNGFLVSGLIIKTAHARVLDNRKTSVVPKEIIHGARRIRIGHDEFRAILVEMSVRMLNQFCG